MALVVTKTAAALVLALAVAMAMVSAVVSLVVVVIAHSASRGNRIQPTDPTARHTLAVQVLLKHRPSERAGPA
jgi:hypothetical protein